MPQASSGVAPRKAADPVLDLDLARKILEAAPNIIYAYDVQNQRGVFQNRRFGELLGQPPAQEDGPSEWQLYIHPEDGARFPVHRERLKVIEPHETLFWEFRMRDAAGHWRWFMTRDTLLSSDAGGRLRC